VSYRRCLPSLIRDRGREWVDAGPTPGGLLEVSVRLQPSGKAQSSRSVLGQQAIGRLHLAPLALSDIGMPSGDMPPV